MINTHPTTLKKADLVRVALGMGLGPSRAALDVYHHGELLKMVTDAVEDRLKTIRKAVDGA